MAKDVYHYEIAEAQRTVEAAERAYLQRWGWKYTCNTPGSLWMYRRDFADVDARRLDAYKARGERGSRPLPYGIITANADTAVHMTAGTLDEQHELEGQA